MTARPAEGRRRFSVGIVGVGIAGLTALMAAADLGERRLDVELVSPAPEFVLRPQLIGRPWGQEPVRVDLAAFTARHGARHLTGTVRSVVAESCEIETTDGATRSYDALLLAPGAVAVAPYEGVPVLGPDKWPGGLASADRGSLAVVVPAGTSWTLPAYQLALLAAGSATAPVRVVTAEPRPLAAFGPAIGLEVEAFLERHGVEVETRTTLGSRGEDLLGLADVVVALPLLRGPPIVGVPLAPDGFIAVDERQRAAGSRRVWAAGDGASAGVKQGGLAAHQAEVAAGAIVASAGLPVPPGRGVPVLRGKLVAADREELYVRRAQDGVDTGRCSGQPLWRPEAAMLAWRLSRWLAMQDLEGADPLGPVATRPAPRV